MNAAARRQPRTSCGSRLCAIEMNLHRIEPNCEHTGCQVGNLRISLFISILIHNARYLDERCRFFLSNCSA